MTKSELPIALKRFLAWLDREGSTSYDPYDIWGTRYSLWARRVYYRSSLRGLALIAPLLVIEILCPPLRRLFAKKDRFATADAQLLLGYLNLHRLTGNPEFLKKSRQLGEDLLGYSIPGYSGYGWGYPFDWQNQRGMWPRNTPFITCTPYCYEAFCGLFETTGEDCYRKIAESIATFVFTDLHDTPTGTGAAAASYSPIDHSQVINATAYRAWVLTDAAERFGYKDWQAKAEKNIAFVLQSQRSDGSWFYAMDGHGNYIDHFHTCFVLKKLQVMNRQLQREDIREAIRRGYDFYRRELFFPNGLPKMFALKPRTGIVRHEMYDFAEAITLGALLLEDIPEAFRHAEEMAAVLGSRYQLPDGHFVTRVYSGGWRHTFPFIRWPQSQLFFALTNLEIARVRSSGGVGLSGPPARFAEEEASSRNRQGRTNADLPRAARS